MTFSPCPKPAPKEAKGRAYPKRSGKPKAKKRSAADFARVYGSRERVRWIKAQPCCVCVALSPFFGMVGTPSHNAHTEAGGTGFKAGYATIVPLCAGHHRRFDEHQAPFDDPKLRAALKKMAANIDALWQSFGGSRD